VLSEFGRLRRRDACSSAKLYDVCDAGADDHLCRTRTHGNICDAAYHDGNPLALVGWSHRRDLGRILAPPRGAGLAEVKGRPAAKPSIVVPVGSSTNIRTKWWLALRAASMRGCTSASVTGWRSTLTSNDPAVIRRSAAALCATTSSIKTPICCGLMPSYVIAIAETDRWDGLTRIHSEQCKIALRRGSEYGSSKLGGVM
jgi:hypothetical protein